MKIKGTIVANEGELITGKRYFVIRRVHTEGPDSLHLQTHPGCAESGDERIAGLLRSGMARLTLYAEGAVEIYRDELGRRRAKQIDAEALLTEWKAKHP